METLAQALKGRSPGEDVAEAFEINPQPAAGCGRRASAPHGAWARRADRARRRRGGGIWWLGVVVAAVIAPGLEAGHRAGLRAETATSSLGEVLGIGLVPTRMTCMRRWTGCSSVRTPSNTALAARHLTEGH